MAFFTKVLCLRQLQYLYKNIRRFTDFKQLKVLQKLHDNLKENFSDVLIKPQSISNEIWESIRNQGVESTNAEIVDSLIFRIFQIENCPDAGINYYKFLKTNNYNCSTITETNYLVLSQLKETLTDADKAYILNICKEIKKQYSLLPAYVTGTIIQSLCQIDKWEEAIKTLEEFEKNDSTFLFASYETLIQYFMKNDKPKLGCKYFFLCIQKARNPTKNSYSFYLKYCLQERDKFNSRIEDLFLSWRKYGIVPNEDVIDECIRACNEVGCSAQMATVYQSQCKVCHEMLEETELSMKEINYLREAIKKTVITSNAYKVSDPQELKRFEEFISQDKQYDYVIDGLNLFKSCTTGIHQFQKIIESLKNEGKRVLVIGRYHMRSPKILRMTNSADFFFVNNLSNDDAFILYATFLSGRTNLISRDLMRQHKFKFHNIELEILFRRWQLRHQYFMDTRSTSIKQLRLLSNIGTFALKNNNCWHIPYHDSPDHLNKNYKINWACFKMPT